MSDNTPASEPPQDHDTGFAGRGSATRITDLPRDTSRITRLGKTVTHNLGVWRSTAICGNDITSSVLYVSALCAAQAGALAPIVLLVVSGVLYLYQKVYAEVGSALPLNGGTYTVLLNTTNKRVAAGAACLTLLSYVATAVISASEAMHYAHNLFSGFDVLTATVVVLAVFALLSLLGITESATIALGIFIIHLITLTMLAIAGGFLVAQDPSLLVQNWSLPNPKGLLHALFFGFAAAMLGISGFESSANFIEEQQRGVFPKTLRNMWIAVTVFNPLISLLSLGLLPLAEIQQVPPDLLAKMGVLSVGPWFGKLISVDAVLVLSGAVLTSYVGVTGLVRRMTLDRCLPQLLLRENAWRKTNHWIILGFFALCTSILFVTHGHIAMLAGVYALSFLGVMALFAVGNMLLKRVRAGLLREVRAGWMAVIVALFGVLVGILGHVLMAPMNTLIFGGYFLLAWCVIVMMFLRIEILKGVLLISRGMVEHVKGLNDGVNERVLHKIEEINSRSVVFFTEGGKASNLNQAALYVLRNEETNNLKIVHIYEDERKIPEYLSEQVEVIDDLYPQLRIDFLAVQGQFNAEMIERLSRYLKIPKNMMFIGAPSDRFPHSIEEFGGVRVILS